MTNRDLGSSTLRVTRNFNYQNKQNSVSDKFFFMSVVVEVTFLDLKSAISVDIIVVANSQKEDDYAGVALNSDIFSCFLTKLKHIKLQETKQIMQLIFCINIKYALWTDFAEKGTLLEEEKKLRYQQLREIKNELLAERSEKEALEILCKELKDQLKDGKMNYKHLIHY